MLGKCEKINVQKKKKLKVPIIFFINGIKPVLLFWNSIDLQCSQKYILLIVLAAMKILFSRVYITENVTRVIGPRYRVSAKPNYSRIIRL